MLTTSETPSVSQELAPANLGSDTGKETNNSSDDFELGTACSVIDPDCEACQ
jgi:hypothetical protein